MAEFNYTEYLRNNPLLKQETNKILTENQRPGYHDDGTPKSNDEMSDDEREEFYLNLDDVSEYKSSKMKVSELKAKIKEDIIATLSEEQKEDLDENHTDLDREVGDRIESLLNISMKQSFLDMGEALIADVLADDMFDPADVVSHLANELDKRVGSNPVNEEKSLEDELMADLSEGEEEDDREDDELSPEELANKYAGSPFLNEDEEEEEDVEIDVDVESEEDLGGGEAEDLDPEAGLSQNEADIQNALKVAYDNAIALDDEKLADQIGNTITMFTRTRVVNR